MSQRKTSKKSKFYNFDIMLTPSELTSLRVALSNYVHNGELGRVQVVCRDLLYIFNSSNADVYEI